MLADEISTLQIHKAICHVLLNSVATANDVKINIVWKYILIAYTYMKPVDFPNFLFLV